MLDEDFKSVKRTAIVITPQQPFFDWVLSYDPEMIINEEVKQGVVYLLPDYETVQQIENWIKKNYDELFEEMLFGWYTDEAMWPQKRTFKIFKEWFNYALYPLVFDTQEGYIEKV